MSSLVASIIAEIRRDGPMAFSSYVDRALYDDDEGFYATRGRAGGRRGDFVTSVEVGTLFPAVVGRWLDEQWRQLGSPERFVVAEAGAGVGTFWRGLHRASPACAIALDYCLVERSAAQRAAHAELPGQPRSLAELPADGAHVIVANELLDNLGFDIVEAGGDQWYEVRVHADGATGLGLGRDRPVGDDVAASLPSATGVGAGVRLPWPSQGSAWLTAATECAPLVLAFDYAATVEELITRGVDGWLRSYAVHERIPVPMSAPGAADITHDVPYELLRPSPSRTSSQAAFLERAGIGELVQRARDRWHARSGPADLDALFARSAVQEADALLDPAGLGGFMALEWST